MRCFVSCCKNRSEHTQRVSFHKIPIGIEDEWLKAVGASSDLLITSQRVCSEHFKAEDFYIGGNRKLLKPGVVPTINLPLDIPQPPAKKKKSTEISTFEESPTNSWCLEVQPSTSLVEKVAVCEAPSKSCADDDQESCKSTSTNSSLMRQLQIIRTFHNYSRSPTHFSKQINEQKQIATKFRTKYFGSLKTNQRMKKKIKHLKEVTRSLRRKNLLTTTAIEHLESCFSGIPQVLMKRMLKNAQSGKRSRQEFSPEIKRFAMTLQFYSDKAYRYVRTVFNLALPAESTIRVWLAKVNCDPGFSTPSINTLKIKNQEFMKNEGKPLLCCLLLDEISIKKGLQVDPVTLKTWGYIDFGCDFENENDLEIATEALVLMIVGINCTFKIPIGYFFIHKLNGQEKANIVREALKQLYPTGITILGLTCDGPRVNFKMMAELGCNINNKNMENPLTSFLHPIDSSNIFVLFDICHMLKLVRNNWEKLGQFKDPEGNIVDWRFIKNLNSIQENESLVLANKLRRRHVQFRNCIMKVNVAAQTLSASVADAIEFLNELHLPEFFNSQATIKFIRLFDKLFDLLNSRNPHGRAFKTPMKTANENYWQPFLLDAIDYIKNCTRLDGVKLTATQNGTGFIGFIVSAISLHNIYHQEVKESRRLKYLLTYKLSQDHLELFFCSIRSRNGWVVNPSCMQFARTYKRLLVHTNIRDENCNCVAQDQTSVLTMTSTNQIIDVTNVHHNRLRDEKIERLEEEIMLSVPVLPLNLSDYSKNVVSYIAGYVILMVQKHVKCPVCLEALQNLDETCDDVALRLIAKKSRGGLMVPSQELRELCYKTELKIKLMYNLCNQKVPSSDICIEILLKDTNTYLQDEKIFKTLENHVLDQEMLAIPHKKQLIQIIIKSYAKIRLHSLTKSINEDVCGTSRRITLSRLLINTNQ